MCGPTSDEAGHLVSGVAMVRTGDPGFYRVNPPLHKLLSGVAVEVLDVVPLPNLYPASFMASGARQEFEMARGAITADPEGYRRWFIIGRLVRLPLMVLAGWWLWRSIGGPVAGVLWLTSPMVLGHGWVVMPDAVSGVAMVVLIVSTFKWL